MSKPRFWICETLGTQFESPLYYGTQIAQELKTACSLGMQAVQTTWYRKADFERLQEAFPPEFPQIGEPMELMALAKSMPPR